jgi:hypothetical protein
VASRWNGNQVVSMTSLLKNCFMEESILRA